MVLVEIPHMPSKSWKSYHRTSDDERIRLGAIQAALDRGYGRPAQAVQVGADPDSIPVDFHMDFGAGLITPTSRKFSA